MLFVNYRHQWTAVKDVKDNLQRLETVEGRLTFYAADHEIQDFLLHFMISTTLRSLRRDACYSLRNGIREEFRQEALAGNVISCLESYYIYVLRTLKVI